MRGIPGLLLIGYNSIADPRIDMGSVGVRLAKWGDAAIWLI